VARPRKRTRARAHDGEGSWGDRPDGRHTVAVMLGGKRYARTCSCTEPRDRRGRCPTLLAKWQALTEAHRQGLAVDGAATPLRAWLDHWLRTVGAGKAWNTRKGYANDCKRHIGPRLGAIRLGELRKDQVNVWLGELAAAGLAPRTVQHAHGVLRSALAEAVDQELLARNVAARRRGQGVRVPDAGIRPLDVGQVRRLLETAPAEWRCLVALAVTLGLRQGELFGLRWAHVDLDARELRVVQQAQHGELAELKSKRARRVLPLTPWLVGLLREQYERVGAMARSGGRAWRLHGLVFPSAAGTPHLPGNFHPHWSRMRRAAGLPRETRWHDLRHTCATLLLADGWPLWKVSQWLGHSSIYTTIAYYAHYELSQDDGARLEASEARFRPVSGL
jgi:integrase